MTEIHKMNRALLALQVGDIVCEEWTEDDGWLTGEARTGRGDAYRIVQIVPGDDGWLSGRAALPRLTAQNMRTGESVNLLSQERCCFLSMRTGRETSRNPYILLRRAGAKDPQTP